MSMARALDHALDLARAPALARTMRRQTLPPDVIEVMRIVVDCDQALDRAVTQTGRPRAAIEDEARLYLQQVLLFAGADSHRILGIRPDAPREEARAHMRLLTRWLHPDHNRAEWAAVCYARVVAAWNDCERRGYRLGSRQAETTPSEPSREGGPRGGCGKSALRATPQPPLRHEMRVRIPWIMRPLPGSQGDRQRGRLRLAAWTLAGAIVTAGLVVPDRMSDGFGGSAERASRSASQAAQRTQAARTGLRATDTAFGGSEPGWGTFGTPATQPMDP